tara:strand:- start:158 stop:343 length:186 start_codon:yes stop_codon:yes gene_type:complete
MQDKIDFTSHIFEQLTTTLVALHELLSDVTSRSDLMAQELIEQQERITRLEGQLNEKDNSR